MTSGAVWNTRPFRPETLEAAREAARRSGLSLGTWLDSAILDTATDAGVRARRGGPDPEDAGLDDEALTLVSERLDELARRIDRLTKGRSDPDSSRSDTAPARAAPDAKTSLHLLEARLASDVRALMPQRRAATQRLADLIRDLTSRLDRLGTTATPPEDISAHPAAIETTLRGPDEDRAEVQDRAAG
jgi:hypothetical protein